MTPDQIVRAWKDVEYGNALPTEEASMVPAHPVGDIELSDDAMGHVAGGMPLGGTQYLESLGCCKGFTQSGYCDITAGPIGYCTTACMTFFLTGGGIC